MMRPVLALTVLLAIACGTDEELLPDPEGLAHDQAIAANEPSEGAAAPTGEQTTVTFLKPYTIPTSSEGMTYADSFTFYGWNADGSRYAFSSFYPGPGAAQCEGKAQFFVVDADTDSYVKGAHTEWSYPSAEPDSESCPTPAPQDRMTAAVEGLLAQHGIILGLGAEPQQLDSEDNVSFAPIVLANGTKVDIGFETGGDGWDDGAWFGLSLEANGITVDVETGKRKRGGILGYSPKMVFFGPGNHMAIVTERSGIDFEGQNLSRMTNGLKMPEGW